MRSLPGICFTSILAFGILISPSLALAQQTRDDIVESFISEIAQCSSSLDLKIDADLRGSIKELLSGSESSGAATIGLRSFLELFKENDRIKAYEIYTNCLLRRYETPNDGSTLEIGPKISNIDRFALGDISEKEFSLENFIDGSVNKKDVYKFTISRTCKFSVKENGRSDKRFHPYYSLQTSQGGSVYRSPIGTHPMSFNKTLGTGDYIFSIFIRDDRAGYYVIDILTSC